jgi:hypothetical protein
MQTESYAPFTRADRLVVAADELHAAALDLVDEWEEAAWIGDASTTPTGDAVAFLMLADCIRDRAVEIADARREA